MFTNDATTTINFFIALLIIATLVYFYKDRLISIVTTPTVKVSNRRKKEVAVVALSRQQELVLNRIMLRNLFFNEYMMSLAMDIMHAQHPDLYGFLPIDILNSSEEMANGWLIPYNPFIQIIHDQSDDHWITVTNIINRKANANSIRVFDSSFKLDRYTNKMEIINKLYKLVHSHDRPSTIIKLVFEPVQIQLDRSLSGCFALAFAFDLCNGREPERIYYKENEMRTHVQNCMLNCHFDCFPLDNDTRTKRSSIYEIDVYLSKFQNGKPNIIITNVQPISI